MSLHDEIRIDLIIIIYIIIIIMVEAALCECTYMMRGEEITNTTTN